MRKSARRGTEHETVEQPPYLLLQRSCKSATFGARGAAPTGPTRAK
ncbi:hypothetical protein GQA56_23010 [Escherichia coli]|nr:hypothetical protein [Escherichia coli]MZR41765.1 hypothetical protein [Escherichia coli]